jgi:hypothetical protein
MLAWRSSLVAIDEAPKCTALSREWTAQAFLTNDLYGDADEVAHEYDGRVGIEPLIAELKGVFGIGKVPSEGCKTCGHAARCCG